MNSQPMQGQEREWSVGDVVARRLYDAGCRFAFGIPGGEVLHLIDCLTRAGIRFVLTKHENGAGFMAEGAYYGSGLPGILVTTLGPGVTNGVTAIANAMQERVPMLVLTGCIDAADSHSYTHQIFDHRALLAPITKASFTLVEGAADTIITKALAIALDGRPGPVHIDVPIDAAAARCAALEPRSMPPAQRRAPASGPALDGARDRLRTARRPVIIAGLDVTNQRAERALAEFAERLGIPVITTYKAKGVLPEDHPLSLGGAGLSPKADAILLPFVGSADLVLLVGYDPIEMRIGWREPFPPDLAIDLAAVANTHFMHRAVLSFVTDIVPALSALGAGITPRDMWPDSEVGTLRQTLHAAFMPASPWGPATVFEIARERLPRNTVATADSGAHRILLSQMWRCYGARDLRQSTGLCTMGCALPLAIGSKLAEPDRTVVAFVGDAGLEMVLGELATVRQLGLQIIVIVLVDGSLALIEMKQRRSGLPNVGVDTNRTDFAAIALAFGGQGLRCHDRVELAGAIDAALAFPGLTVIACEIADRAYDGTF